MSENCTKIDIIGNKVVSVTSLARVMKKRGELKTAVNIM